MVQLVLVMLEEEEEEEDDDDVRTKSTTLDFSSTPQPQAHSLGAALQPLEKESKSWTTLATYLAWSATKKQSVGNHIQNLDCEIHDGW